MYSLSSYLMRIPREVNAVQKLTILRASKAFPGWKCAVCPRSFSDEEKSRENGSPRQFPIQHICYSVIIGAASYTTYKLWLAFIFISSIHSGLYNNLYFPFNYITMHLGKLDQNIGTSCFFSLTNYIIFSG